MVHTRYGLGGHIWEPTSPEHLMISLQLVFVEGVMYNVSLMAIKTALFAQYYRLISQTEYRIPCLVLASLVILWCLGMIFIVIFGCYPVQAAWDFTIVDKDCTTASHGIVIGIGNIITDFMLIMLPVPIVWKLKMKTSQKLVILGMCFCPPKVVPPPPPRPLLFSVFELLTYLSDARHLRHRSIVSSAWLPVPTHEFLTNPVSPLPPSSTCLVSILRLNFLRITDDFSYSAAIVDCWTIGELSAACSCPSLMVLQPFLKKLGIDLGSFRHSSSLRLSDAVGRSGPSIRKIVFGPSSRSTGSQPGNMHGSEVELYQLYHKV